MTKETFSGMSAWLRVVTRANMYSWAGCVLHKVAIPKRGIVYIINIIGLFIVTSFWQMAVKYPVLAKSRLTAQLSAGKVKCAEEVASCSNSHASPIWDTFTGTHAVIG